MKIWLILRFVPVDVILVVGVVHYSLHMQPIECRALRYAKRAMEVGVWAKVTTTFQVTLLRKKDNIN